MKKNPDRRRLLLAACGLLAGTLTACAITPPKERIIKIGAKRYEFWPREIHLQKGHAVVFELSSADVIMGFALSDFGIRADVVPGKTSLLQFTPDRTGEFTFHCDVFCGEGHEDMSGTILVTAP